MRSFWSGVAAVTIATTMGLSAQSAPPAAGQAPDAGKAVTLNGCLQSAAAPAGAPTTTSKFVLAVKPAPGSTAGGPGRGSAGTRYRLDGDEKAMSPHLNHVVEVNGTVQPTAGDAAAAAGEVLLKVAWVKMVAATCS